MRDFILMGSTGTMAIGGSKFFEIQEIPNRTLQTDLHINHILDTVNSGLRKSLFKVCNIVEIINYIAKKTGFSQEQSAKLLRKSENCRKIVNIYFNEKREQDANLKISQCTNIISLL